MSLANAITGRLVQPVTDPSLLVPSAEWCDVLRWTAWQLTTVDPLEFAATNAQDAAPSLFCPVADGPAHQTLMRITKSTTSHAYGRATFTPSAPMNCAGKAIGLWFYVPETEYPDTQRVIFEVKDAAGADLNVLFIFNQSSGEEIAGTVARANRYGRGWYYREVTPEQMGSRIVNWGAIASLRFHLYGDACGTARAYLAPPLVFTPAPTSEKYLLYGFDDCLASAFDSAAYLLRHGVPVYLAAIGNLIGTTGYMSAAQLRVLKAMGADVVNHLTVNQSWQNFTTGDLQAAIDANAAILVDLGLGGTERFVVTPQHPALQGRDRTSILGRHCWGLRSNGSAVGDMWVSGLVPDILRAYPGDDATYLDRVLDFVEASAYGGIFTAYNHGAGLGTTGFQAQLDRLIADRDTGVFQCAAVRGLRDG